MNARKYWSGVPSREFDSWSEQRIAALRAVPAGGHIHIIGICGTGTGALLQLLVELGYRVTGSDKAFYPPMGDIVKAVAAKVYEGYSEDSLTPTPDCVIVGNTAALSNPEVEAVLARGIPFCSMPEALSALLIGDREYCPCSIVITGTHGKTTTTTLTTWLFEVAGRQPAYFIGGVPDNFAKAIRPQAEKTPVASRVVLLEGDEYDSACFAKYSKFHAYRPDIVVITSLEFDHGDIFDSIEAIEREFNALVTRIPATGVVFVSDAYPRLVELAQSWKNSSEVKAQIVSYGTAANSEVQMTARELLPAEVVAGSSSSAAESRQRITAQIFGQSLVLETSLSGEHNAQNLLVASAVAQRCGVHDAAIIEAAASFTGVKRRQQLIYDAGGVRVIEDFAHHPTAIDKTLAGLREKLSPQRLIAVFDPRSNTSRRHFFQESFARSFSQADVAIIRTIEQLPSYSATGAIVQLDVERLVNDISASGVKAQVCKDAQEILAVLAAAVQPGDVIVVMSNGAFEGLPQSLPEMLRNNQLGKN
jgi:UDP-N-acetylmuramate: L-alanyl-gamma-D-glutamyl-meso-diaminopimelate ligase